jgi:DMSO/TMAO reductase YedYZ molybdopterin-dependent catalytic subunit
VQETGKPPVTNGRIVRSEDPLNLEMPFSTLEGFLTPTESFYVRTHFGVPKIDGTKWRLHVEGAVERPFEIGYEELVGLESQTVPVTLECAGNNRIFLEPKVKGVQWELGAVGTAEWTGVPLSSLLKRAGLKQSALEVILEGADTGTLSEPKGPQGKVRFARSLPLQKATEDVLLVHRMNGKALLPEHGFPVRAIVPGWYAMASVKWLQRIIVTDAPFSGYYQTLDYAYWAESDGLAKLTPLSTMQLKAEIASPASGSTVPASSTVRVHGAAWGGEVAKVEVSVDGGTDWKPARWIDEARPNAWRRWEFEWATPARPGRHVLMARATDSKGRSQPLEHDPNRGTYMISRLLPIEVEVR